MSVHKEIKLEDEICDRLSNQGWIYEADSNTKYDSALALFPEDVSDWVKDTQPKAWDTIQSSHGANTQKVLAERVRKALDSQGIMDVLRQGFDMMGLRKPLSMCQFKPALGMNADLQARYTANRLRVVRQVRYSQHNGNSIDLVLFVNGIPVATIELKSHYPCSEDDS